MALRKNQDAGAEFQVLGDRGREREWRERIGNRDVFATGNLAARRIRIWSFVILRDDDVLDGPDRFDSDFLGGGNQMRNKIGLTEGAGIGEHQTDFHGLPREMGSPPI